MTKNAHIGLQRSTGRADVVLGPEGRPMRLHQQGSAKAIWLPGSESGPESVRESGRESRPEVTFLNTSGGLAGGDSLALSLALSPEVVATATTQTAERAYRSTGESAQVDVRLEVGKGGFLHWLPQETILFDAARLMRRTVVTLAPGAGCLLAETVVLGRAAMGETVARVQFDDRREVRRNGRLVWMDPLQLTGDSLSGSATLQNARAFSTVALICDWAGDLLAPLRCVLDTPGVRAAASALPGRLMLRIMADEALPLRRQLIRALAVLQRGVPLPRVWQI